MKNPLLFLFLWVVLASPAFACDPRLIREYTPIADRLGYGMLYVVEDCTHPASYVFGTVHLDDREVTSAAAPAFAALGKSERAVFELESGDAAQREIIRHMLLPPEEGRTLSQIVGEEAFSRLSEAIPGYPRSVLERYRPWAASVMAQFPPPATDGVPLDDRLQHAARQKGIPVFGLETVEEQMAAFTALTEQEQVAMLRDTLDHMGDIREMTEKLHAFYLQGDLGVISALGETAFDEIRDTRLRVHLRRALIAARNETLTKAIWAHLEKGRSFIAVGALHLPGKEGILNRLEAAGYYIWPVSASVEGASR